jgi:hypothetical protein
MMNLQCGIIHLKLGAQMDSFLFLQNSYPEAEGHAISAF